MTEEKEEKLGSLPYVIAGISFIPLIGVVFGIIAMLWGLFSSKKGRGKLILIGVSGILFTIILYSSLFYVGFVKRGGMYDELRTKLGQKMITDLVKSIEFYKIQTGSYPTSLEALQKSNPQGIFVTDPTDMHLGGSSRNFFYQIVDANHYYLRGVGSDGQPFTSDDILPNIEGETGGLLINRQ